MSITALTHKLNLSIEMIRYVAQIEMFYYIQVNMKYAAELKSRHCNLHYQLLSGAPVANLAIYQRV